MLKQLELCEVGPSGSLKIDFTRRLNILTGDNGLGKTFVTDIAWWTLTRSWVDLPALPYDVRAIHPAIKFKIVGKSGSDVSQESEYNFKKQQWPIKKGRAGMPGLVIYARVDGSFSVWDPARNHWREEETNGLEKLSAYHFSNRQLWDGLEFGGKTVCNGLIRDWITWQYKKNQAFDTMRTVLRELSPDRQEKIEIAEPCRIPDVAMEIPVVTLPYGNVPVTHASAGMRRIIALAYLLVWVWEEHKIAAKLRAEPETDRLVFLFDEVESHLHPLWQRVLLPSLLRVFDGLSGYLNYQIIASTHSPLVLASIETEFDEASDALFNFRLTQGEVVVDTLPWAKQGDVLNWLVSDSFGLKQGRSREAEVVIEAAEAWMRGDLAALPGHLQSIQEIDAELRRVLPGHDPFWPRWIMKMEDTDK